ncbi:hypothetical protein [Flagellimonas iocasae]|uniref:Glycine zipper 2TM domain-containing protein n=1 Tax=Flagellimonas iocasae TaxID=2055905 RepID=A0ABW4XW30_9FLAO
MRTLIPTLVLSMLISYSYGQIERDKTLHFLGGSLFGLAGAGIAKQTTKGNRVWTFVGAVTGSALAGLAKEAIDSGQPTNSWDNDDLLATVLGGVTVGLAVDIFSKKDSNGRLRGRYSNLYEMDFPFDDGPPIYLVNGDELPHLTTLGLSKQLVNYYVLIR